MLAKLSATETNYVIYYSPTGDGIEVYRVLHAARQREDHL